MNRRVTPSIVFAVTIVCAIALGRPAWSQDQPLSRSIVSDTNPQHKAHISFTVKAEQAYRAQVQENQAPGLAGPTNAPILYNGGPVMRNPSNYLIFWQPPNNPNTFPAGFQAGVENYFKNVGGTPFYNIVTQYNDTSSDPVPNSTSLGAAPFIDSTTLPPSGNNGSQPSTACTAGMTCPLTDADIQNEVTAALAANPAWQKPGINVEYFVFTPPNVGECFNATNCFALPTEPEGIFCAYHTFFNGNTIYAYQPFNFSAGGNCTTQSVFPNGQAVDEQLSSTTHEMFESNTDPLLNAWFGTAGLSDEVADKCAFNYGYVAPTGTNIVLMGNPFQLQQMWSNDVPISGAPEYGCTKRYGPAPGTSIPTALNFGTVAAGTVKKMNVLIQNTAGGDLNILNIRFGPGTDPSYSLLNVPPLTATIHESESITVVVQFAPTAFPPAGPLLGSLVVDTDDPAQTTYTTNFTGLVSMSCAAPSGTINVTGSGNFGTATCSSGTPPQTLQINNVGTCNLDVTSVALNAGCVDFTLVNPGEFPTMISPDSGLPVQVEFTPTSAGPKSCTLTITSSDPANPTVSIPLSGNTMTGTASLQLPGAINFPPTLIQQDGACPDQIGVPVTNAGLCPVEIDSVTLTQSSVPPDYSLTGLPGLPVLLATGDQLGAGDLDLIFEPFTLSRTSTGTVNVTFVNDPITGTTLTDTVPFCGEAVNRGMRVLVTEGGVPVAGVKKISLQSAFGPTQPQGNFFTHQTIKNAPLQTFVDCAGDTISYHAEFGGITNTKQLKVGEYRVKVELKVGKKTKTKIVRVNMGECTFTPNVVVAF